MGDENGAPVKTEKQKEKEAQKKAEKAAKLEKLRFQNHPESPLPPPSHIHRLDWAVEDIAAINILQMGKKLLPFLYVSFPSLLAMIKAFFCPVAALDSETKRFLTDFFPLSLVWFPPNISQPDPQ